MSDKTIRVDDRTYARLAALKADDEPFNAVLQRLLEDRDRSIREGAGLWADSGAAAAARAARQELKPGVGHEER